MTREGQSQTADSIVARSRGTIQPWHRADEVLTCTSEPGPSALLCRGAISDLIDTEPKE